MKTADASAIPTLEPVPSEIAPPPIHAVSRFLSRRDVARLFGVSASTITRWARTGLIAAVRTPGGHYRYRFEEVVRAARAAARIDS